MGAREDLHARFDAITAGQLRDRGLEKWGTHPDDTLGAFVAEMDFGIAPPIRARLLDAVENARTGYISRPLLRELNAATAAFLQRRHGWQVEASHVHAMPDVMKALETMLRFHLPAGAPVIVPTPCYMPFIHFLAELGHAPVQVPVRHDGTRYALDYAGIDAAFDAGAGALLLCNPHNPIGRVYSREELLRLSEIVEKHDARVFSDEIHAPLIYAGNTHVPYAAVSPAAAAHAITAVSASKAWNLPGLKCAQIVFSNDDDLRIFKRIEHHLTQSSTSTLGIFATLAAYDQGEPWLADVVDYLQGNRDFLAAFLRERLPQIRFDAPQGTYLAWLDCAALNLPQPLGAWLREHARVALTDGAFCGDGFGHCVRLNFATPRPILAQLLERIAAAFETR